MKTALVSVMLTQLACLAGVNDKLHAQEAETSQPTTRLLYELPIDAMQRTLLRDSSNTMESLLKQAIDAVAHRLSDANVTRVSAVSFTVDLPTTDKKEIATARSSVESIGTLEMRMLARADYDAADLNLEEERERLQAWLDKGGRAKLQKNLNAIERYRSSDPTKIRWVPRKIPAKNGRWMHSLTQIPTTRESSVRTFTDEQWNNQRVPNAMVNDEGAFLVELVAINMHESGFSHLDLQRDKVRLTAGINGEPGVLYEFVEARRKDYAAWSKKHTQQATAVIVNGELVSAPIFVGQITRAGIIVGNFDLPRAQALIGALQSGPLPAKPELISQQLLPAKAASKTDQKSGK